MDPDPALAQEKATVKSDAASVIVESTVDPLDTPAIPLSKRARKKAQKAALFEERKLERRAREKEAKKEKKRKRAERVAAGENVSDDERVKKKPKGGQKTPFDARVVVDLGFDDKMSEKARPISYSLSREISSLCSQLAYTYSANRRSSTPFTSLLFTSLNGRTLDRLEAMNKAGYKRWSSTEWWSDNYDHLWTEEAATEISPDKSTTNDPPKATDIKVSQDSVVYLTADTSEELMELKEGETYIIGGICDHNRYKNLCLNKARESGIRAAQLPIGRYLSNLPTRKVLTVNQVFEILVKWVETRDWEEALYSVIPKRKFQDGNTVRHEDDEEVWCNDDATEGREPDDA
ncbi:guanine-1-methyltransferase-domain-containing protein [Amylostereum chailletii]|nr:guanine-1-methyltransferase-domain-containing protein [Amylostereum chailletii]